jgi:hypothetical protein
MSDYYEHESVPGKAQRIYEWLIDYDAARTLIIYGDSSSGKSTAFWQAIGILRCNQREDCPHHIYKFQGGNTITAFELDENETDYAEERTVIILTTTSLPFGMAELMNADTMYFEREE